MEIKNGTLSIGDASSISPSHEFTSFTDNEGNRITIPNTVIIRLYCILMAEAKIKNINFDEWMESLFKTEKG